MWGLAFLGSKFFASGLRSISERASFAPDRRQCNIPATNGSNPAHRETKRKSVPTEAPRFSPR
jgi:hypothetical protein